MLQTFFSQHYAEARDKFLDTARRQGGEVRSHVHPAARGRHGETLSMDTAYLGSPDDSAMLVLTSAMHGEEGFCGSGCQLSLLNDEGLLARARSAGVGILMIHAVNPYGFSWGHRTNEDNIDLNRNFCDFSRPLRDNPHYRALHPWLVPDVGPPAPANEAQIQAYADREGEAAYRFGMMAGQHEQPEGLFYGGRAPAWSNTTLRGIFREYGPGRRRIGWIDYHTGLGPCGHAEKIFVQKDAAALARARAWWGADVIAVSDPASSTVDIAGTGTQAMLEECADVPELTFLAMEYGTVSLSQVYLALRADRWLAAHPDADDQTRAAIKAAHRAAFYVDTDEWRGAVAAQSRVSVLQALLGLAAG